MLKCPQTWPWEAGRRAGSASAARSKQLQAPLRPRGSRDQRDRRAEPCDLQAAGREGRWCERPHGLPLEPQGPPCRSTDIHAASPRPPPLFWVPTATQHGPRRPSLIITPPTGFPGQSHHRNAILIPQHWGLSKCRGTTEAFTVPGKGLRKTWGGGTEWGHGEGGKGQKKRRKGGDREAGKRGTGPSGMRDREVRRG